MSQAPTNLSVPGSQQPSSKTLAKSGSSSSLRRSIEHEDDLVPHSRSRRNSESDAGVPTGPTNTPAPSAPAPPATPSAPPAPPMSAAARAGLVPLPAGHMQAQAENAALTAPVDWEEPDHLAATAPGRDRTAVYVGKTKRQFNLKTSVLKEKSPYWQRTIATKAGHDGYLHQDDTTFDDLDDFSMGLFMHWLMTQGKLHGPHDFHSLAHYLSLYVLAKKFEIEGLQNQVLDLVRHYYAEQNMTAPAYRLEYVYRYTSDDNHMRHFLINTAAFRALEEAPRQEVTNASPMLHKTFYSPGSYVSDSIKQALHKNPDMAVDFVETLVKLHRNGEKDARHGIDCDWHVHEHTKKCKEQRLEPWQNDGADDAKDPPKAPGGPSAPTDPKPEAPKPAAAAPPPVVKPADPPKPAAPAVKPADPPKAAPAKPEHRKHSPWCSETERLQWEKTEQALAKEDESPFKEFVKGIKEKMHEVKEKIRPDDKKPDASKSAAKPDAPK